MPTQSVLLTNVTGPRTSAGMHKIEIQKFYSQSAARGLFSAVCVAMLLTLSGCVHSGLYPARENFYLGRFDRASDNLSSLGNDKDNRILLLMERGTILQAQGKYKDSTRDWVEAWELSKELDYYSISRGAASLAVNERVKTFNGMPYERTLLHSFAAKSFIAMNMWDDAAVEARNIMYRAQNIGKFPDDPYSQYLAGFCMEMINDYDGAMRQYAAADKLLENLTITAQGRIMPASTNSLPKDANVESELVCFLLFGRAPAEYGSWQGNFQWGQDPYVELYSGGKYLGRSYNFTNTQKLLAETQKQLAALRAAKDVTRIVLKEVAAEAVSERNQYLGEIVRLVLFSLEAAGSNERRWETLPNWMQIARVPCPPDIKEYEAVFKGMNGRILSRKTVKSPMIRRGRLSVSFCRDIKNNYAGQETKLSEKKSP